MKKTITILALLIFMLMPLTLAKMDLRLAEPISIDNSRLSSFSSSSAIRMHYPEENTRCEQTTIKVANAEIHNIPQMSFKYSKIHIKAEIVNTGCADAKNVYFELHYKPDDYLMGPTIEIQSSPASQPISKIKVGDQHKKELNFMVELHNFYPFGPFPADNLPQHMLFYVTTHGDNTNSVKSRVLEFSPIEEAEAMPIEEPEKAKEPVKEITINKIIKKVDLAKVRLFN